jgi:hypothetical protein
MLGKVFVRFVEKSPISVMVYGVETHTTSIRGPFYATSTCTSKGGNNNG